MNTEKVDLYDFIMENLHYIAKKEGFVEYEIGNFTQPKVIGFISNMACVVIQGKRMVSGYSKVDKLHLICKFPTSNQTRREMFNIIKQFDREIYMYNHVLPAFIEFQKDKGLSEEDGFYAFPKCYLAKYCKERNEHVIILEDLSHEGYIVSDYEMNMNIDHSKIVLKNLAKLHAISLAIRNQNARLLNKFKSNLSDIYVPHHKKNELFRQIYHFSFDHSIKSLKSQEFTEIKKLEKVQPKCFELLEEAVDVDASEPFGVVNHGDCFYKNVLFKYDHENIPKNIYFIDFQLSRYGSPALDIAFFMFTSTTEEFRNRHYNELIRFYYDNLVKTLVLLSSDAQKIISFQNLQEQLTKFGKFASILSSIYVQVLTDQSQPKDMEAFSEYLAEIKMSENTDIFENINLCKQYNEHMSGVVRDSVKYGYY